MHVARAPVYNAAKLGSIANRPVERDRLHAEHAFHFIE